MVVVVVFVLGLVFGFGCFSGGCFIFKTPSGKQEISVQFLSLNTRKQGRFHLGQMYEFCVWHNKQIFSGFVIYPRN